MEFEQITQGTQNARRVPAYEKIGASGKVVKNIVASSQRLMPKGMNNAEIAEIQGISLDELKEIFAGELCLGIQ